MFRENPELAPLLLDRLLKVGVPAHVAAKAEEGVLDQLQPIEFRADLAVKLLGDDRTPQLGIAVEVQLEQKDEKLWTWPVYLTVLRAKWRCRTCVLVVAPDPEVAAWAAAPIDVGPGNEELKIHALGPPHIPKITDAAQAREFPELAIISALAHGNDPKEGWAIVEAALAGSEVFDPKLRTVYHHLIWKALRKSLRRALEALLMDPQLYAQMEAEIPPFIKKYNEMIEIKKLAEQWKKAVARQREVLLKLIARFGLELTEEQRQALETCDDPETLDRWIDRALSAQTVEEILG